MAQPDVAHRKFILNCAGNENQLRKIYIRVLFVVFHVVTCFVKYHHYIYINNVIDKTQFETAV